MEEKTVYICDICGDEISEDDVCTLDNDTLCENCYDNETDYCSICGERHYTDDMTYMEDDGYICEYCFMDNYTSCDNCGEYIHIDNTYTYREDTLCENCYDNRPGIIHKYSFKPSPSFHGDGTGYFGIEIEIDSDEFVDRDKCAIDLMDYNETLFYLKEDSSLSSDGIEIVSHPCTFNYWMENSNILKSICDISLNNKYRSHDTDSCGFHIHASKSLFGSNDNEIDMNILKAVLLFERFWDQIIKISRRSKEDIETWSNKYDMKKIDVNEMKNKSSNSRYKALNITRNTIELRIFKGTLKYQSILSAIEFYNNTIEYCCNNNIETILKCSFNEYKSAIEKDTVYLMDYLNTRLKSDDLIHESQTTFIQDNTSDMPQDTSDNTSVQYTPYPQMPLILNTEE